MRGAQESRISNMTFPCVMNLVKVMKVMKVMKIMKVKKVMRANKVIVCTCILIDPERTCTNKDTSA